MHTGLERVNTAQLFKVGVKIDNDLIKTSADLANVLRELADSIEQKNPTIIAGLSSNVVFGGSVVGTWLFGDGIRG